MKFSKTLIFTLTFGVIIIQLATARAAQPSSYKDFGGQAAYNSLKLGTDSTSTRHTVASHSTFKSVALFNAGDYLMLECKLNGKLAYFMIDTGASFTVLHSRSSKQYDFQVLERKGQQTTGFGGNNQSVAIALDASLDIGGQHIAMGFLSQDLSKIARLVHNESKVRIAGIIGSDLLKRLGCRLDLQNKTLRLMPGA